MAPKDDDGRHNQDLPVPCRKVKILIVDNDPRTLRIHENLLKSLGGETRAVKDGREAINVTAWNDYSLPAYDLILIGRHLPFRNGIRVTKTPRAIGYPSRIVGVTHSLTEAETARRRSSGKMESEPFRDGDGIGNRKDESGMRSPFMAQQWRNKTELELQT
ncbi:unnamed protein product [Vicia faba]|uniref:Response regulatory domain-containing protein n=1 Tax=Vicia faba TaxID=3906 RepID=A0AAV0YCR3_VICFA|nr:unnamed protein product [Vicia faba]